MDTRYHKIDTIRGLCVISMVLYHTLWTLQYFRLFDAGWFRGLPGYIWQQSICQAFILISGFCFGLDRRPIRRGIILSLLGAAITAVTYIFVPRTAIVFGILTLLGASVLIAVPLSRVKLNPLCGFILSLALFMLLKGVNSGYLGCFGVRLAELPQWFYRSIVTAFFGFPPRGFASADYFSLLPWFFLYMGGYYLFRLSVSTGYIACLKNGRVPVVGAIGRNALKIYIVHQPVIFAVVCVLKMIMQL
ncbi:MAG TPA: DUF1624 domain-containing protein [Candidatus Monoglobus merdigallinarum]|uniref:DUF1624 domain-containing protein n=1 Tax=Candidatus Monoglobus merdigallinarum TaxID=2838698 RepID=A0A9D1TLF6_9FIRM|nr:DUF1624 domain-containing protein [Candidatus Monoglobus merdigallinarum]